MTGIIQLDAANLSAKILPAPALARQLNILENGRRTHHLTKTQSPEIQPPILTSAPSPGGRSLLRAAATRFISSPQTPTLLPSQPNVINAWFNKEFINDTSKNRGINEKVMAIAATRKDESTYAREKTNASVKINTPSDPLPTMIPREMDHTLDNTIILSWVDDLIDQVVAFIPDLSEAGRDEARDAGRWGMVSYVLLVGLIALSRWGEKAVPIAIQRILTSPRLADFFLTTAGRIFKTTLEHWGVKLLHRTTLFFANIGLMMGIDHASQEVDAHLSLEGPLSVSTVSNAAALFLLAGAGNYLNKETLGVILSPRQFLTHYWNKIKVPKKGEFAFSLPDHITHKRTIFSLITLSILAPLTLLDLDSLEGTSITVLVSALIVWSIADALDGYAARSGLKAQTKIIAELLRRLGKTLEKGSLSPDRRIALTGLQTQLTQFSTNLKDGIKSVDDFKAIGQLLKNLPSAFPELRMGLKMESIWYAWMVKLGNYPTASGALYDAANDKIIVQWGYLLLITLNGLFEGDPLTLIIGGIASNTVIRGDDRFKTELRQTINDLFGAKEGSKYTPARLSGKIKLAVGLIALIAFYSNLPEDALEKLSEMGIGDGDMESTQEEMRLLAFLLMLAMMMASGYSVHDYSQNPKLREAISGISKSINNDLQKKDALLKLCKLIGMPEPK